MISKTQQVELREVFNLFDLKNQGEIEPRQLKVFFFVVNKRWPFKPTDLTSPKKLYFLIYNDIMSAIKSL